MKISETTKIRPPAVAGSFYPADPAELDKIVMSAIERVEQAPLSLPSTPKAVISPHAGYRFSGLLTAAALSSTKRSAAQTIVILSPSHRHAFKGIALPSVDAFQFPGSEVAIDQEARQTLLQAGLAHVEDAAHEKEHGIETQLPILKKLHPQAKIVPLVIGETSNTSVAHVVDHLAKAEPTPPLFVLSSDLSHFKPLELANDLDGDTARLIEVGGWRDLTSTHACGFRAISGYCASDFAAGDRALRIARSNSYAMSGDATRTVGYGSWALMAADDEVLGQVHRALLLRAARQALVFSVNQKGRFPNLDRRTFPSPLHSYGATFVTLKIGARLRGCIGSLAPQRPIIDDVVVNTVKAAFQDQRFHPVRPDELGEISIKIALLSPAAAMSFGNQSELESQLSPGRDGLIMRDGNRQGTFLPMVWDQIPDPHDFIQALKVKAGLPKDHWSDALTVARYRAESFALTAPGKRQSAAA